jgi:hypothetical protein
VVEVLEELYQQKEHLKQRQYLVASLLLAAVVAEQKLPRLQVSLVVQEEAAVEIRPAAQAILLLLLHLKVMMAVVAVLPAHTAAVAAAGQVVLEVQHQELVAAVEMVVLVGQAQTVQ